jgi:hypothetical protein
MIERYKPEYIKNKKLNRNNYNEVIKFLNNIDPKIPNCLLWNYYGGIKTDFILFK